MKGLSALPLLAALHAVPAQAEEPAPVNICPTVLIDQLPVTTEIDPQTCRDLTKLGVTVETIRANKWAIKGVHMDLPCLGEAGKQPPTIDVTDSPELHPDFKVVFQTTDATRNAWQIVMSEGEQSHTLGIEGNLLTTMDGQPLPIQCQ